MTDLVVGHARGKGFQIDEKAAAERVKMLEVVYPGASWQGSRRHRRIMGADGRLMKRKLRSTVHATRQDPGVVTANSI